MANKVPGFGINTLRIKGIKSTYKAKVGPRVVEQEMTEYQEAEKEAKKEDRREASSKSSFGVVVRSRRCRGTPHSEDSTSCTQASSSLCLPRQDQPGEGQTRI